MRRKRRGYCEGGQGLPSLSTQFQSKTNSPGLALSSRRFAGFRVDCVFPKLIKLSVSSFDSSTVSRLTTIKRRRPAVRLQPSSLTLAWGIAHLLIWDIGWDNERAAQRGSAYTTSIALIPALRGRKGIPPIAPSGTVSMSTMLGLGSSASALIWSVLGGKPENLSAPGCWVGKYPTKRRRPPLLVPTLEHVLACRTGWYRRRRTRHSSLAYPEYGACPSDRRRRTRRSCGLRPMSLCWSSRKCRSNFLLVFHIQRHVVAIGLARGNWHDLNLAQSFFSVCRRRFSLSD